jgi:hypothetical protein
MFLLNAHQRTVAARVVLGCWLFAFFVGVAQACGLGSELGSSQRLANAWADIVGQADDAGRGQFCAANLPVLQKLQAVQDQPGGQPLLLPPFLGEPLLGRIALSTSPLHRSHAQPRVSLDTLYGRLTL